MKSIDLLPTDKNILKTLYTDTLNRNNNIKDFLSFLTTIEGHFTVSLNGEWGTGKTFFIKQCVMILNVLTSNTSEVTSEEIDKISHLSFLSEDNLMVKLKNQKCVYFNAWEYDNYQNPRP